MFQGRHVIMCVRPIRRLTFFSQLTYNISYNYLGRCCCCRMSFSNWGENYFIVVCGLIDQRQANNESSEIIDILDDFNACNLLI